MPVQDLVARLRFLGDAAIANMDRASAQFGKLTFNAERAQAGFKDMNAGFKDLAVGGALAGAGAAFSVKKFMEFDDAMAAVKAVLGPSQASFFPVLEQEAKRLGATTSFTAKEAANAMEELARAGQSPKEVMQSIGPVLAAAAAEGMELATAAEVVAANLAAFQLPATEAARVADTLAYVSATTATSIVGLQEGMKYVAPVAKQMGFSLEDTAAALGALSDVGLTGSLAGTGLKNAISRISAEAKNGAVAVGPFSAKLKDANGNLLPLKDVMINVVTQLNRIKDPLAKNNAGLDLLGLRGIGTAAAFDRLANNTEKMNQLFGELRDKALPGSAAQMQKLRLDSLKGDFTLLTSAIDGVVLAFGSALAPSVRSVMGRGGVGGLSGVLTEAAKAFQYFASNANDLLSDTPVQIQGVSSGVMSFVKDLLLGLRDVRDTLASIFGFVGKVAGAFSGFSSAGGSGMTRLATHVLGVTAALAPLALGLGLVGKTMRGFARVGIGAFKVLTSFLPSLKGGGGAAGKLAGAAAKAAAQPVRVVNFDEMPGGVGAAGAGAGAGGAAPAALGKLATFRAGLNTVAGKLPLVGSILASNIGALGAAFGKAGLLGKLAMGGGLIAAVGAAGAAGYAFGSWLNNKLGISDKIANGLDALFRASEHLATQKRVEAFTNKAAISNATKMAGQFALLSGRGVDTVQAKAGSSERAALTRAYAEKQVAQYLATQGFGQQQTQDIIKSMASTFQQLKIEVKVDGQKVATATTKTMQQAKERGVGGSKVVERRRAVQGVAMPVPAR